MRCGIFKQNPSTVCLHDPADDFQTKPMLHPILLRAPSRLFPVQGFQKIARHPKTVVGHPKTTFRIVCVNRNHDPAAPRIVHDAVADQVAEHPRKQRFVPLDPETLPLPYLLKFQLIPPAKPGV